MEHLLDPDYQAPADIPGYGPISAGLADEILCRAGARVWWRRLFTAPTGLNGGRIIIGGDPTVRRLARHPPQTS